MAPNDEKNSSSNFMRSQYFLVPDYCLREPLKVETLDHLEKVAHLSEDEIYGMMNCELAMKPAQMLALIRGISLATAIKEIAADVYMNCTESSENDSHEDKSDDDGSCFNDIEEINTSIHGEREENPDLFEIFHFEM